MKISRALLLVALILWSSFGKALPNECADFVLQKFSADWLGPIEIEGKQLSSSELSALNLLVHTPAGHALFESLRNQQEQNDFRTSLQSGVQSFKFIQNLGPRFYVALNELTDALEHPEPGSSRYDMLQEISSHSFDVAVLIQTKSSHLPDWLKPRKTRLLIETTAESKKKVRDGTEKAKKILTQIGAENLNFKENFMTPSEEKACKDLGELTSQLWKSLLFIKRAYYVDSFYDQAGSLRSQLDEETKAELSELTKALKQLSLVDDTRVLNSDAPTRNSQIYEHLKHNLRLIETFIDSSGSIINFSNW